MSKTNEGKACDAVICRIEARVGSSRHDLTLPEKEGHAAPIEVACRIGERLFAFEHTRVEPFEGHIRLQADAPDHFRPVEQRLAGIFAPDTLLLTVPAKAIQRLNRRQIETMRDSGRLVIHNAPTLPRAPTAVTGRR